MNEAKKHTPGPWHYGPEGMGDFTIASEHLAIAAVVNGAFMAMWGHADEHEANARLIAAAPEMLAALKEFLAGYDRIPGPAREKMFADAEAAIAKAEGPRS